MSHEIETRDRQVGVDRAWHGLTIVESEVTPELAHPYEVVPIDLRYRPESDIRDSLNVPKYHNSGYKILLADDDELPVGKPYNELTYSPNTIHDFWDKIKRSMKDVDYEVISAGSVRNRSLIFASIKVSEGFEAGGRKFNDYLSFLDGFDSLMSFRAVYSNICVVCSNTFHANLGNEAIARVKHTKNFQNRSVQISSAVQAFLGQSEVTKKRLEDASTTKVTIDEAAWFFTGFMFKYTQTPKALKKRRNELVELFREGQGNEGQTRLDAFSAVTERFTHGARDFEQANFGRSSKLKEDSFGALGAWDVMVERGKAKKDYLQHA